MNGEQRLLHNVLCILGRESGAPEATPRNGTDRRREAYQQPVIGGGVAIYGCTHQAGPIAVALAHVFPECFVPNCSLVTKQRAKRVDCPRSAKTHVPVKDVTQLGDGTNDRETSLVFSRMGRFRCHPSPSASSAKHRSPGIPRPGCLRRCGRMNARICRPASSAISLSRSIC